MTRIRIKRVYEAPAPDDGAAGCWWTNFGRGAFARRPCNTIMWAGRLRPRPSCARGITPILRRGGRSSAAVIRRTAQLAEPCGISSAKSRMPGTVTLLYASKNAAENRALVLQEYLQRAAEEAADKTDKQGRHFGDAPLVIGSEL